MATQGAYKSANYIPFVWNTFRMGLNTLLRENELDPSELAQCDNLMLKGRGIPTKRYGTALYFNSGATTSSVRGLKGFYKADGTNELLAITDDGYLVKQNGSTFTSIIGASYASGAQAYMTQLNNAMYIVNGQRELTRYSSPTLVGFPTLAIPTGLQASNISNATGTNTIAYRVSAISNVGETLGSQEVLLPNQPDAPGDPAGGTIWLSWSAVSAASGILQGYNIYGRDQGFERFISSVNVPATTFYDDGSTTPSNFSFPPTADSTGGPKAKTVIRFQDRLIFGGLAGEGSKLLISARAPYETNFDVSYGGNYLRIEPDAGDDIVQLATYQDRIIVFKQRSIWQITLTEEQVGNFFVTTPNLRLITNSHGCIAPRSVVSVRDDIYYLSRKGVYSVGYQPGFTFDVLRTNELSLKIRPYYTNLTVAQLQGAVGAYFDFKYLLAFPSLGQTIVFDIERGAWLGPWTKDANVFEVYYDSNNNEHLLRGDTTSSAVDEFSSSYINDKGTPIVTILRTRQEDFGDWSLFKNLRNIFTMFRNITGTVIATIRTEQRSGSVVTAKNFNVTSITGNSGWGADQWGQAQWGSSHMAGGGAETQQTIRWNNLNKAVRNFQLTLTTINSNDNYELLGIRGDAKPIGSGFRPSSWRIT